MRKKIIIVSVVFSLAIAIFVYATTGIDESNSNLPEKHNLPITPSPPTVNAKMSVDADTRSIKILKSHLVGKIESGMVDPSRITYLKLPEISLEQWLKSTLVDAPLEWKEGGCAEYDSNVEENSEHCVSYLITVRTTNWRCPEINLNFSVQPDGVVYFLNDGSVVNDFGTNGYMQQIGDLEKSLSEVKAKTTPNRPSILPAPSLNGMTDSDMIAHAQALDVHILDSSLPSERLDKWLERSAHWPMQWFQASAFEEYRPRCEPKRIILRAYPALIVDPENKRPPADIMIDIGSWERGIEGTPKLAIYFQEPSDSEYGTTAVKDLNMLQKKFDNWNTSLLTLKPTPPIAPPFPKVPVVQNMSKLGDFSRIQSPSGEHCYGLEINLWKYGERIFGTLYDFDGQCADSQAPTYTIQDVKYDPVTESFEFVSYGVHQYKFVGKLEQNIISGKFLGLYPEEEVKLKRSKNNDDELLLDSNKNVEAWCKDYAPNVRYGIEKEFKELCKSLGIH